MMNRKFQILAQKSRFFRFSSKNLKKKLHQPNRFTSTKFDFVDVDGIITMILIIGFVGIRDTRGNLGEFLKWKKPLSSNEKKNC